MVNHCNDHQIVTCYNAKIYTLIRFLAADLYNNYLPVTQVHKVYSQTFV